MEITTLNSLLRITKQPARGTSDIDLASVPEARHGSKIVSALGSGLKGPGLSPGLRHCVVFLEKTLYSHSASLHPRV